MSHAPAQILFKATGLSRVYPGVQALNAVDFEVYPGEVHALVGENGAGKSSLAKIISGLDRPTTGTMRFHGESYAPLDLNAAEQRGVRIVTQELHLIPTLTVAENLFLRHLPAHLGWIGYRQLNARAAELLAQLGLTDLDPRKLVSELGIGRQQLVELCIGLAQRCQLLILDEPTAALTNAERDLLFAQLATLKATGAAVIYISHRMEEIFRLADRITVLRDGQRVSTRTTAETDLGQVIREMVGRELHDAAPTVRRTPGALALRVRQLTRRPAVRQVSFDLHRGEILGLAGLVGCGRTETVRAIFGADRPESGEIFLAGRPEPARIRSPKDAVRQGIALLTEDRKEQGLLLSLSLRVNITLTRLSAVARAGILRRGLEETTANRLADLLAVRRRSLAQPATELSGGNQQKIVLAKWLFRDCDILIFDEPTRGIDIGARSEIYRLLSDLAEQGKAILVVSSDLPELMTLCDRIAVMSAGSLVQEFSRGTWSQDAILTAALRGYVTPTELTAS